MTHKSTNLSHSHDDEVQALYEAICEQAKKVMDPMSFMLFTLTPWNETDGKSIMDAADEGDTATLQIILDGLTADVAEFLAENPEEDSADISVTAEPVSV